ncbi:hypothetical protein MNBD_ALPHA07-1187 [hydrothermal vent metagenome]|uniref:Lipoprotein n=1 Tax=hydrothermal vent metagenome TaxID=652676 RepID=A0A3B0TDM1_9ZZZZ
MTRTALLTTIALSLVAGPALALSCLAPDVARTYKQAAEAEETYIVVYGQLSFDEGKLPIVDYNNQMDTPNNTLIPARVSGKSLTLDGFNTDFDKPITLNAKCFGPWCAKPASGVPYLAFLERTVDGYTLVLDPCGGYGFSRPSEAIREKAAACFQGGECTSEEY